MLLEEKNFYVYSSDTDTNKKYFECFEFLCLKALSETQMTTKVLIIVVGEQIVEEITFYKRNLPKKLSWN